MSGHRHVDAADFLQHVLDGRLDGLGIRTVVGVVADLDVLPVGNVDVVLAQLDDALRAVDPQRLAQHVQITLAGVAAGNAVENGK